MKKELENEIEQFKIGLFLLNTRRFGVVAEYMVQVLYGFKDANTLAFDKTNSKGERVEVKFSRVLRTNSKTINRDNIIQEAITANVLTRILKSNTEDDFDCNIQQIKTKEFDILYYGLFFDDIVYIYKIKSEDIKGIPGYSDKQHRGNVGEGQFHINNKNLQMHKNNLDMKITYEELYDIFS